MTKFSTDQNNHHNNISGIAYCETLEDAMQNNNASKYHTPLYSSQQENQEENTEE